MDENENSEKRPTFLKSPPARMDCLLSCRGGGARWEEGGTMGCREGVFWADFISRPPES